ncbi:uncharacterized protein [Antedon mediterranea]|uniref:uncharacterized protein n=1 Tax=Antedon mediterranea TaxID=105859 RepID=UPI003AF873A5
MMMRTLFVACVLGLIACTGAKPFDICPVCHCKPPTNGTQIPKLLSREGECYCFCGLRAGDACGTTGECEQGLYCTAPRGNTNQGICEDACFEPGHHCDTYEQCMILNNKPECSTRTFTCTSFVHRPVCSDDLLESTNRCFYENYRKEQNDKGIVIHILGFGTCQEVMGRNQNKPAVHAGNTYNPLNAAIGF